MYKKKINPETVSLTDENNNTLSITNTGLSNEIRISTSPINSVVTFRKEASEDIYRVITELSQSICQDTRDFNNYYQDSIAFRYNNFFDNSRIRDICGEELHVSLSDGKANITVTPGSEQFFTFQIHNAEKLFQQNTVQKLIKLFGIIKKNNKKSTINKENISP